MQTRAGEDAGGVVRVLVVSEDPQERRRLRKMLLAEGPAAFKVARSQRLETALRRLGREPFDALVLDLPADGRRQLELLPRVRHRAPETAVVVVTGTDGEVGLQAVRLGAQYALPRGEALTRFLAQMVRRLSEAMGVALTVAPQDRRPEEGPWREVAPVSLPDGSALLLWTKDDGAVGVSSEALVPALEEYAAALYRDRQEIDSMAEQLLESYEEINLFYELAEEFGEATDEEALSQTLLSRILDATSAGGGAVLLTDHQGLRLVARQGQLGPPLSEGRMEPFPQLEAALERGVFSDIDPASPGAS